MTLSTVLTVHIHILRDQAAVESALPLMAEPGRHVIVLEPLVAPIALGLLGTLPQDLTPNYTLFHERVDWVVVGGDTGPEARPLHPAWVKAIRDECLLADVPFYFRGWGDWVPAANPRINHPILNAVMVHADGRVRENPTWQEAVNAGPDWWLFYQVGAKKAGRTLHGDTYDAVPDFLR